MLAVGWMEKGVSGRNLLHRKAPRSEPLVENVDEIFRHNHVSIVQRCSLLALVPALAISSKSHMTSGAPAATCAGIAHEHDSSSSCVVLPTPPALSNVWAAGLLTHRVQIQLAQLALDLRVLVPTWHLPLQPVWLACLLLYISKLTASVHEGLKTSN